MSKPVDRRTIMSNENESSISVVKNDSNRRATSLDEINNMFLHGIQRRVPHLPDSGDVRGMFLENGARLYQEIHGHPEWGSPECSNPKDAAIYDQVCERYMQLGMQWLQEDQAITIHITRHNMGAILPDTITMAQHESYLWWKPTTECLSYLVPHMVSRTLYAGAGCLSAHPDGTGFEFSQRVRHVKSVIGSDTTHDRALVCSRVRRRFDRCESRTWQRLHLITKDAMHAPDAHYLTLGATALVVHGLQIPFFIKLLQQLAPVEPLTALRQVSLDTTRTAVFPLVNGTSLTALEMQRRICAGCQEIVDRNLGPEWAPDLLKYWRAFLDGFERNPLHLAPQHDAYLRWQMFTHAIETAGSSWPRVHTALRILEIVRNHEPKQTAARLLDTCPKISKLTHESQAALKDAQLDTQLVPEDIHLVLRLLALDLELHRIGGLYETLRKAGSVTWGVIDEADVDRAMHEPPTGTRAALRGRLIKELSTQKLDWHCDWNGIYDRYHVPAYSMLDPFQQDATLNPVIIIRPPETSEVPF